MPTKLKRYNVSLTKELEEFLIADAAHDMRPVATHVTWICEQYRLQRMRQAEQILNQKQSREGKAESYVYGEPELPAAASSKSQNQTKSGKQ